MFVLTATDLPRFMQCNGSRKMYQYGTFDETADTTIRDEGNAAHWLAQQVFNGQPVENFTDRKAPNGVYVTPEIVDYVEWYLTNLANRYHRGMMEVIGSVAGQNWLVKCRADHISYDPNFNDLFIDDFKFGYKIVEPENNWTLISHAIAHCIEHGLTPNRITFAIHQPRAKHYRGPLREWSIDYAALCEFYAQMNAALSQPDDILNTGVHCRKCPALACCPAATKSAWVAVDESEVLINEETSNQELSKFIDVLEAASVRLENKLNALKDLAFNRLKQGQIIDGYCLEQGLGNTSWKGFVTPEMLLFLTGKDLTTKKLISPTQAKAQIDAAIIENLSERPRTGVKLKKVDTHKRATAIFNTKG